jgi:hypothetical protein
MTNLNYKDESNCILLAEVFDSPKNGGVSPMVSRWADNGLSRKERRKGVFYA